MAQKKPRKPLDILEALALLAQQEPQPTQQDGGSEPAPQPAVLPQEGVGPVSESQPGSMIPSTVKSKRPDPRIPAHRLTPHTPQDQAKIQAIGNSPRMSELAELMASVDVSPDEGTQPGRGMGQPRNPMLGPVSDPDKILKGEFSDLLRIPGEAFYKAGLHGFDVERSLRDKEAARKQEAESRKPRPAGYWDEVKKQVQPQAAPQAAPQGIREDAAGPAGPMGPEASEASPDLSGEELNALLQTQSKSPDASALEEFTGGGPGAQGSRSAGFESMLDDADLSALTEKATSYNKPGILEYLAVIGSSLGQSPGQSMQLAQMLRGEPERASAERSLGRLVEGRSRRAESQARMQGQVEVEGARQGGMDRRAQLNSATRLEVEKMRGQRPQAGPTPGQKMDQAKYHALGRVITERGNIRQALRGARMSMDPSIQQQIPTLEAKLRELDALERQGVEMLHRAGAFGDESAAMFALGEGWESDDMDPETLEAMRQYSSELNRLIPR